MPIKENKVLCLPLGIFSYRAHFSSSVCEDIPRELWFFLHWHEFTFLVSAFSLLMKIFRARWWMILCWYIFPAFFPSWFRFVNIFKLTLWGRPLWASQEQWILLSMIFKSYPWMTFGSSGSLTTVIQRLEEKIFLPNKQETRIIRARGKLSSIS